MEFRNEIIGMLSGLSLERRMALLMNNAFQAGLDALDPNCSCYVRDRAIRECIYLGLRYLILAVSL